MLLSKSNAFLLFYVLSGITNFVACHKWRGMDNYHTAHIDVKSNQKSVNTTVTERSQLNTEEFRHSRNKASRLQGTGHKQFNSTSQLRILYFKTKHLQNLTLTVSVNGHKFILVLQLNNRLFPANYSESIVTRQGNSSVSTDVIANNCYYTGTVRDEPGSTAAVSTCNGIVGFFQVQNESYYIEPFNKSKPGFSCLLCKHKVYAGFPDKDLLKKIKCGMKHGSSVSSLLSSSTTSRKKRSTILDWPQDLDSTTKIVELYVVVDHAEYVYYNSSFTDVTQRVKTLVNILSATFQPLDIYIVLVGVEVWSGGDMITVNTTSSKQFLANFATYSQTSISVSRDVTEILTNDGLFEEVNGGGIAGLASVGAMCSPDSVFFVVDFNPLPGIVTTVTAHEMGHVFGLNHDDNYDNVTCACSDPDLAHCVMYSATLHATMYWSACSKTNLTTNLPTSASDCLHNMPTSVFDTTAVCGDGLVEGTEQCDCGRAPSSECNPSCCSNVTCQHIGTAQCAFGRCCNIPTCTFKPAFVECRANLTSCDLSEYCSGTGNLCPTGVYKQDYTNCTVNGISALCYGGECRSRESQCEAVWGSGVGVADSSCYTYLNKNGVLGQNCGLADPSNTTVFKACAPENVLCGLLQCNQDAVTVQIPGWTQTSGAGLTIGSVLYSCESVFYPTSDTGMVPNGALCGSASVCLDQVCTPISNVSATVTCPNCTNHGICNSLGQCHCDVGYAPPDCSQPGNGGSVHSNGIKYYLTTTTARTTTTTRPTTITTTRATTSATTTTKPTTRTITTMTTKPTTTITYPSTTTKQTTTLLPASTSGTKSAPNTASPCPSTLAPIISRCEWNATTPTSVSPSLTLPVMNVVVHHTMSARCFTKADCINEMRGIQKVQMTDASAGPLGDIAYNFLIGDDGNIYEGVGWATQGRHVKTPGWNAISLGVAFIGNYKSVVPSANALAAFNTLLSLGQGPSGKFAGSIVQGTYSLMPHYDQDCTLCPGGQLKLLIQGMPNYGGTAPISCALRGWNRPMKK